MTGNPPSHNTILLRLPLKQAASHADYGRGEAAYRHLPSCAPVMMARTPESPIDCADLDAVYAKIARRIIPFTALLFLMAWLDRYNLGFAKLQMNRDLGFSEAV